MSSSVNPNRGEIWLARLDPIEGHEQAGTRPVLVISGDRYNRLQAGLRIILPLTSRDRQLPFHIQVDPPDGGVQSRSFVISEQPRTISVRRFDEHWGTAPAQVLTDALMWVNDFLND